MPTPGENKTVHPPPLELQRTGARILAYAEAIHLRQGYSEQVGGSFVSPKEAEERRAPSPEGYGGTGGNSPSPEHIRSLSFCFNDLLRANPFSIHGDAEAEGAVPEQFPPLPVLQWTSHHLHIDITMRLS